jgi:hypothetical protein
MVKAIPGIIALLVLFGAIYLASQHKAPHEAELNQKIAGCNGIKNGETVTLPETSRTFINLPQDAFPDKNGNLSFTLVSGTATAGWVSNGGLYGEAMDAKLGCWSYYYEFNGKGTLELVSKTALPDFPNYKVTFVIQ